MTMLTPIADSPAGALPFSLAAIPGLPDETALARLAGELFRALPGSEAPSSPSAPGVSGLAIGEPGPALQPVAAPSVGQVPVAAGPVAPEFGVPEAYAAALPMTAPISAPAGVPGSPYYFLGEAAALSSAHQAPTAVADNHVVAHPFERTFRTEFGRTQGIFERRFS